MSRKTTLTTFPGYLRVLLIVGSFGIVFGHMMLSLCTTYWQALLAQGIVLKDSAGGTTWEAAT